MDTVMKALAWAGIVLCAMAALLQIQDRHFEQQAVQHHAAHYDPATGEFMWNDQEGSF